MKARGKNGVWPWYTQENFKSKSSAWSQDGGKMLIEKKTKPCLNLNLKFLLKRLSMWKLSENAVLQRRECQSRSFTQQH